MPQSLRVRQFGRHVKIFPLTDGHDERKKLAEVQQYADDNFRPGRYNVELISHDENGRILNVIDSWGVEF